jgi:vesicle transport protein SEC22
MFSANFVIFLDTYLQKAQKIFSDGRSRRNMNALNNQLQDVQRIMVQNIDDVLQRGTVLSGENILINIQIEM